MTYLNNPFVGQTPLESSGLRDLVDTAKLSFSRGWVQGTSGNFSLRLRKGLIWQSPSGLCKGSLKVNSFIPIALETGEQLFPLKAKPSEEMPVHLAIYSRDNTAGCVVHVHLPQLSRHMGEKKLVTFEGEEMLKVLGCRDFHDQLQLKVAPNQTRQNISDFCRREIDEFINWSVKMLIFSKHGVYAWGKDPFAALKRIEALEFLCQKN